MNRFLPEKEPNFDRLIVGHVSINSNFFVWSSHPHKIANDFGYSPSHSFAVKSDSICCRQIVFIFVHNIQLCLSFGHKFQDELHCNGWASEKKTATKTIHKQKAYRWCHKVIKFNTTAKQMLLHFKYKQKAQINTINLHDTHMRLNK